VNFCFKSTMVYFSVLTFFLCFTLATSPVKAVDTVAAVWSDCIHTFLRLRRTSRTTISSHTFINICTETDKVRILITHQLLLLLLLLLLLHPLNGLFSKTTWVSRYQKGKTSLDLNKARDDEVWDSSGISWTIHKQSAPCSRHQNPITQFLQARCSAWCPTNSDKALKAKLPPAITTNYFTTSYHTSCPKLASSA